MASIHLDQHGDCSEKVHVPPHSEDFGEAEVSPQLPSDSCDAFGEPKILPRIGDEYQVELPQLIRQSNSISHSRKSIDTETGAVADQKFLAGLPLMLTWINSEEQDTLGSSSSSRTSSDSKNINSMGISFGEQEPSLSRKSMEELQNLTTTKKICKHNNQGYHLVPGLYDEKWSVAEKDCFLLGIYIFEKKFVEVARFVGTKEMGAILSYYYGKFYRSPEYFRWSGCRKLKNKRGILGQRLFSGLRQQELLSRILPRVSEERQVALLKVSQGSKLFGDAKMSLADYVFFLKAMVGTTILVEAVGIGKGKQDLTATALEPSRSNQVIPMRPEIPAGKACSSLTTTEIINFLSGDLRLSKARSNDLFWEAVWPRLLARGWHSEQPKDQGFVAGSKQCLVFLVPGIKQFSRRELVKGDQYFDSVTDILSKVAREPWLIELDPEVDDSKRNEEYERRQHDNDLPTSQKHFYLQPRTPDHSAVAMKFTVVDTSLTDSTVRELRALPSEISNAFITSDGTKDSGEDNPEENIDGSDTNIIMLDAWETDVSMKTTKFDKEILPREKDSNVSTVDQAATVYPDISAKLIPEINEKDLQGNAQSNKVSGSLFGRALEQESIDNSPTTKRSRTLTACSQEESYAGLISPSMPPMSGNGLSNHCSDTCEVTENLLSQVSLCLDRLLSTSSSKGSPCESMGNTGTRMLIDLNLPQLPPGSEDGLLATEGSNEHDITSNEPNDDHSVPQLDIQAISEEQSNLYPRRQSTRIRPLTTRAIEAVANGYLTVNRRRKRKESTSDDGQSS